MISIRKYSINRGSGKCGMGNSRFAATFFKIGKLDAITNSSVNPVLDYNTILLICLDMNLNVFIRGKNLEF